jgi:hypothetical protein
VTGGASTARVATGDDRMIEVVGVPKRPSVSMTTDRRRADTQHVGVAARYVVALDDLRQRLHARLEGGTLFLRRADADHRRHRQAEPLEPDVGAVAADDAGVLHLSDALRRGGRGEADAPAELGKRQPRVLLQRAENGPADGIEAVFDSVRHRRLPLCNPKCGAPTAFDPCWWRRAAER